MPFSQNGCLMNLCTSVMSLFISAVYEIGSYLVSLKVLAEHTLKLVKEDSTIHLRFTCLRLTDQQPFLEDIIIDISFSLQNGILIVELRILSSTIAQIP